MSDQLNFIDKIKAAWKGAFVEKKFSRNFVFSLIALAAVLFALTNFLQFVEQRNGLKLNDPVLNLFNPLDLTWLTFLLIYGSLIVAVFYLIEHPDYFLTAIQTYTLMVVFRITAMFLLPLDAPEKLIPLVDPFVEFFGGGITLKNDLFFSGHTATLFILFLTANNKIIKRVFLSATILVALAVIIQHVHYTIDDFAAPFVSYTSFKLVLSINSNKS